MELKTKNMKLLRLPTLLATVMMFTFVVSACSSDDEMVTTDGGTYSSEETKDDSDASVFAKFMIQDENGSEKYVFKEGENIYFKLDITNNTEETAYLPNLIDLLFCDNIFHVFSQKGEDYGHPFDSLVLPERRGPTVFPTKYTLTFLCPWLNNPDSEFPNDQPPYSFFLFEKFRPLPKGEFYSVTSIKMDENKIVTFKKSFIIE